MNVDAAVYARAPLLRSDRTATATSSSRRAVVPQIGHCPTEPVERGRGRSREGCSKNSWSGRERDGELAKAQKTMAMMMWANLKCAVSSFLN